MLYTDLSVDLRNTSVNAKFGFWGVSVGGKLNRVSGLGRLEGSRYSCLEFQIQA